MTRLSLDSRASARRIRALEEGDSKGVGEGNEEDTGGNNIGEAMRRVRRQWRRVVEEAEEMELWSPHPSPAVLDEADDALPRETQPAPGRVLSCFNESAKLCKFRPCGVAIFFRSVY